MNKLKNLKFICFFLALVFIFTPVLSSCESEPQLNKEWNDIKDVGSLEDLLNFAANPDVINSDLFDEINQKIKDKINEGENPEKLTALLNQYPEREIEFKDRISKLALDSALDENTVESLEKYIGEFWDYGGRSEYISQAEEALMIIYFNEAREQRSIGLLEEFIEKYKDYDSGLAGEAADIINEINEEFDWNDALENYYASENSLLPLINFTDSHPNSIYVPEAEQIIRQIQNDSSYSEKYFEEPDLDLIDKFITNFPGHKDMEKALKMREDFVGDIYSMIEKEYIAAISIGESMTRSRIIIQNRIKSRLEVTVPFGIYLEANSGNVHNILVRKEKIISVGSEQHGTIYVETACMNIYKDDPEDKNYFTINILQEDSQLIKLLKVLDENNSSYEITQAAIWYVTDNPGKDVILDALVYEDGTKAITENDYNEALRLVELAGE